MNDIKISQEVTGIPKEESVSAKKTASKKQWQNIMNNVDRLTISSNKRTQAAEFELISTNAENKVGTETPTPVTTLAPEVSTPTHIEEAGPIKKTLKKSSEFDFNALIENNKYGNKSKTQEVEDYIKDFVRTNLKNTKINSKDTHFVTGELKTREFKISELGWKNNIEDWNEKHKLIDDSVSSIEIKNKRNKTIAHFANKHFYINGKRTDETKFQKFAASKGNTMTVTYSPDLLPLEAAKLITNTSTKPAITKIKKHVIQIPAPMTQEEVFNKKTKKINAEVYNKIKDIAENLNCDHNDLIAVINAESGFNPKARNKHSGATGLIQFMPKTARGLGTTTEELRNMSAINQLEYVEKYLQTVKKSVFKNNEQLSSGQLYALIFLPKYAKKEELAQKGHPHYDLNKGLDVDGDGIISKSDLDRVVKSKYVNVQMS